MSNIKKLPLTDVQFAYMFGRNSSIYLGGIATHFYAEFDTKLNPKRFEEALNKVIQRQEMLRAYICKDGTQVIMEEVPYYEVEYTDLSKLTEEEKTKEIESYRAQNSNRIIPLDKWPMFGFKFFRKDEESSVLAVDIDMMIVDGMSTELLIHQVMQYYNGEAVEPTIEVCFSDYMELEKQKREKMEAVDKEFWMQNIQNFTAGPFIEKVQKDAPDIPYFYSLENVIEAEKWSAVERKLRKQRILPTIYLLTAYARMVSAWTNNEKLTINMTVSDRNNGYGKNFNETIGDFTKILPVDFDFTESEDLITTAKKTQNKIAEYKKHLNCNITSFAREVALKDQMEDKAAFPFVFTSMMFDLAKEGWNEIGDMVYQVSQTPQLLLDNQITLKNGALVIHWDYPMQYWTKERLEKMQKYYLDLVLDGASTVLEDETNAFLKKYNNTSRDWEYTSALELFERQAEENPDNTAVLTENSEISYEELDFMANQEAHYLVETYGMERGYLIEGERNYRTIVHMLAVLKTNGYYVPIATRLPENRKNYILEKSNGVTVLDDEFYSRERIDDYSEEPIPRKDNDAKDLMYVIYTSGTTGNPKGVAITNEALMNTVNDINERFQVTEEDQIIGISSFGFDLSVYDVFGALTSGASLLLHDKQENIYGMLDKLKHFQVSIWNTVPALMKILVQELDEDYVNERLRLVMLSGDWIPTDLPEMIRKKFPNAQIISLGGATEAAIWSIYYPIHEVAKDWSSIPYGYPLANQTMYVLGYNGMPVPVGVEGDIFIGGAGVAVGYQNDPEKTAEAFIDHPMYGKIYRTGDRGVFSPEGYMIFRGRRDTQVKINGNRVELGEIENCLKRQDSVLNAVAQVATEDNGSKHLFAYYVPTDGSPCDLKWIENTASVQEQAVDAVSDETPDYLTIDEYKEISEALEAVSTAVINNAFYRLNFFTEKEHIYSLDKLFEKNCIVEKYNKLIYQWAETLEGLGNIEKVSSGVYICKNPIQEIDVDAMYKEIMTKRGVEYWGGSFEFLTLCNKNVEEILRADVNPLTILFPDGDMQRAENIYRYNPVAEYMNNLAAEAIEQYVKSWNKDRPVRILEFGAGTGGTSAAILERIKNYDVEYVFTDLSTFFTDRAKENFSEYGFVEYGLFNIDEKPQSQGFEAASFDIIIGANVLHDAKIIKETLKNFRYMLTKEGMLVALEVTTNKIYHKVSIGFIEGFSGYNDERLEKNVPLLSATEWCTAMADCGFTYPASYPKADKEAEVFEQHVMVAYAAHNKEYCEEAQLMKVLREELPSYMMPERIYSLYEIPLSANAKVDYKQLPYEYCGNKNENQEIVLPQTETEQILHEIIKETLDLDKLSTDVNIFTIGADSLKSISVLTKLKSRGIEVSLSNMYKYSTIQEMAAHIDAERAKDAFQSYEPVEVIDFKPDLEHRFDPFPMSDLQESYYIGAHETEGFNSIPTAGYVEIECRNYNHDRLFKVIGRLMERHDMLRAYIDEDGMQHVLKELPDFEIPVTDLRNIGEEEREQYLRKVRKDMVSTRLDLTKAPLFKCVISQMTDDKSILHIYADGQIMDGWSFQLFYTELGTLYRDPELEIEPLKATFRDYIMYREELKKTDKYKQDREFWLNKIPTLPSAGVLPIKNDITELGEVEGIQVECGIPIEQWRQIEKMSQKFGVSAFSVLMTSFAVSVARWNDKRRFLLNIPEFYRPAFSEDIFKVLGECASFLLFTMEDDPNDTFREKVVKTQQQIMELKDHNNFSGMEITREIYRKNNGYNEVLAPLVFGMLPDAQEFEEQFIEIDKNVLKIIYQENHTSQIWIDVNTCVYSDRIEFNYNSLKGLIDPEILESLATMQKSVLYEAAASEAFWNSRVDIALPQKDKEIINQANATEENLSDKTMPMLLDKAFREYAKEVYLHTDTRDYTYGEIRKMVNALAVKLGEMGIMPGDKVAVHIGKGIEQMVAALTCAYMGYVYTPLEYDYSAELVESALQWIKCQYLLVDTNAAADFAESQVTTLVVDKKLLGKETAAVEYANVKLEDLVAIIHTSGTTGRPKAVMIRQESLVNALLYTNKRFEVIKTDNAFGVTNPSHDMSMYDIFGMAICGAAVTVPQEKFAKDPEVWIKLMRQHKVTIWNSVPAIQEMLMEAVTKEDASYIENLRLVMLGGDYIKPGVLLKLRAVNSDVKMISVGGPTETTLWNIMHEIVEDDLSKDVIPYGKPIANNRYYILNENKKQLPVGVTGTLYCAGIGVANGYCEDEERTGDKFIIWEETGERIYNTGDRGHYREDGTILFDGRDDEQVKINGKRIELVAIESEALAVEKVKGVAAIKAQDNQLVLFYVSDGLEVEDELRGYLMSKLPAYMVPKKYVAIDEIPITINAKVDKKSLAKLYAGRKKEVAPRISATESDVLENILKEKFCELLDLKMDEIDLDSDFFAMGGNSLIAMKFLSQLRENFDVEITLTDLFMTSTIREMKELLEEKNAVLVD